MHDSWFSVLGIILAEYADSSALGRFGYCDGRIPRRLWYRSLSLLQEANFYTYDNDQRNLDILKWTPNAQQNRRTSNRLFLALFLMCSISELLTMISFLLFLCEFHNTGLPKVNSLVYPPTPFSGRSFFDEITYVGWMMSMCSFFLCIYIEFILRISFHFRVLSEDMRQLRRGVDFDEDEELQKL